MPMTRNYAKFLLSNVGFRPVWPPTSPLVPGDYGEFEDGVFIRLGNVKRDYGINYQLLPGQNAHFEVIAESGSVRVHSYHAGGRVKLLTKNMSGSAEIRVAFKKENGFFIRAKNIKSKSVASINTLSETIADKADGWRHLKWWVLSEVYSAPSCIILGSKEKDTTVAFKGDAKALVKVYNGEVDAGVKVTGHSKSSIKMLGEKGPLLIRIFRVRVNGRPVIR